ncbi:hypothetical protein MKEN_00489300 [Mycena kentingensis (nom. inval.)]|nr:hypothetical protein MKEN_00489300 [Mycena kentingensis (nom. inval.)]
MDPQHGQPSLPPHDPSSQPHSFPAPVPLAPTLTLNDGSGSLNALGALDAAQALAYMNSSGLTQEDLQVLFELACQNEYRSPTPIPDGGPFSDAHPLHTYISPHAERANELAGIGGVVDAGYQYNASGVDEPADATHQNALSSNHGVSSHYYAEFPESTQGGSPQSRDYISNGALAANDYSNVPGYAGAYEREPYIHGQPTRATPSSSYHAGPPCAGPSNDGPSQQRHYHQQQPHASPAHDLRPQILFPQDIVDGNGPYPFTFGAPSPLAAGRVNYDQLARDENYTYPADIQQPFNGPQAGPARVPMTLSNGIPDSSSQPAAEQRPLKQPIPPKRRLPGARGGRKRKISQVDDAPTGALPRLSEDDIKAYTARTRRGSTYVCLYAPGTSTDNAHECLSVEYATRHDIAVHLQRAHDFPGRLVLNRDGPANPHIPCLWEVIKDGRPRPCGHFMTQDEVPKHIFTEHLRNLSGGQIMECERYAQCGTALPVQQLRGHMRWCRPVPEYPAPFTKRFV